MYVILDIHALTTVVVKMFYVLKLQEWNCSAFCINPACILNKVPVKDNLCVYSHPHPPVFRNDMLQIMTGKLHS
jgi:hypothetical protein